MRKLSLHNDTLLLALVFLFGMALLLISYPRMVASHTRSEKDHNQQREMLYLPEKGAVEFLSFGFRNALANVIWFTTINYFGKHYHLDRDFRWLFQLCDLITTLNPRALHVYEFGSTMLSWEQKAPEKSVELLSRGIEFHPEYWKLYYLRGFNLMFFLQEPRKATEDFVKASRLPGVHPVVVRLAGKKLTEQTDPAVAVNFLQEMLRTTEEPHARHAIAQRLHEARSELEKRRQRIWEQRVLTNSLRLPTALQLDRLQMESNQ